MVRLSRSIFKSSSHSQYCTLSLHDALPISPLAERVLLPGDPARALTLAQSLLSEPRMFNHNRGLWGYTGIAADGDALTIQDRKSTRLNSSHSQISYAVFCLKKKKTPQNTTA